MTREDYETLRFWGLVDREIKWMIHAFWAQVAITALLQQAQELYSSEWSTGHISAEAFIAWLLEFRCR